MSDAWHSSLLRRHRPYVVIAALMGAIALLPSTGLLEGRHIHLTVVALIWSMATFGLFIPYGLAGQITVAVAAVWGVGAFSAGLAVQYWSWGFEACLLFAVLAGVLAGLVMALPVVRTKGHYFVIVTFILAQALIVAGNNWHVTVGPTYSGITIVEPIELGPLAFDSRERVLYLVAAVVAVMAAVATFIQRSYLGQLFASVRENEELARSIGVSTTYLKLLSLALGGAFAGVGGAFYVFYLNHIDVRAFGVGQAITIVLMLIVGGSRVSLGPVAGALIIYFIPELINLEPVHQQIAFGVVLAVVVIVLPGGVLGSWGHGPFRTVRRRLHHRSSGTTAMPPEQRPPDRQKVKV